MKYPTQSTPKDPDTLVAVLSAAFTAERAHPERLLGSTISISQEDESLIEAKSLRVLVEFPQRIGNY
ncbi:hypothetical protein NXY35_27395 [Bacteroides ovatus]|nr:hypothetical protein [Bacteroides ovatus]MCS2434611.1 hypothetical protein [Bacteroides ovatus]